MLQRAKITIHGVVQGVGFRPFVYRLANELGIKGWVMNSAQGVFIDAEGSDGTIEQFISRLKSDKPKNSYIQSFEHAYLDPAEFDRFEIRESMESGSKTALVLPDIAICDDCLREILDQSNRRYLYPFTNCTNCGPRYTIIRSLPYDRKNTTMSEFKMCSNCYAEYTDPSNRRFHAEPIACPNCGPQIELLNEKGYTEAARHKAIEIAAEKLSNGKIIALKGIGGYQLLADARNTNTIKLLRTRKRRNEKPFAVMFPDIGSVREECEVNEAEERLLESTEKPIVLLKRKKMSISIISEETAINNPYLGVMLPYSPLHHILLHEFNFPIIATSGNLSEEPICIDEQTATEKLSGIADYYLIHDRKILRHVDDSIARVIEGREMLIRRARGYAPLPIVIDGLESNILAVGPHLKNTIALNKGNNVFISQHIGDLENFEAINAYTNVITDMKRFFEITPQNIVADLHPDYISTNFAFKMIEKPEQVQHHYAHVLSCMAENNIDGEVLGVSWDGTGYGTDGTIWGSEFLLSNGKDFERAAYLKPFRLPGGEKAIHEIWRTGFALLYEVFGQSALKHFRYAEKDLVLIEQMLKKNINSPVTTSMGRLFDGIAAIMDMRQYASFEAQGAMELEFAAEAAPKQENDCYEFNFESRPNNTILIDWHPIIKNIVNDLGKELSKNEISAKFHRTLVKIVLSVASEIDRKKVVLTGGCFQNKFLIQRTILALRDNGFKVYWHQRVPTNDGGISLGQIMYSSLIRAYQKNRKQE